MKVKILTGEYEGMMGSVVSSGTDGGSPRLGVVVDLIGKRIYLHTDEVAYLWG